MSVPVIYRLESVKINEHQRKKSAVITYVYYGFKLFSKLPAVRQTRELIHSCKYLQLPIFELKLLSSFYYFFLKHLVELGNQLVTLIEQIVRLLRIAGLPNKQEVAA